MPNLAFAVRDARTPSRHRMAGPCRALLAALAIAAVGGVAHAAGPVAGEAAPASGGGVGGPLIAAGAAAATADLKADQQFRNLFNTWKKLDAPHGGVISIPSVQPVEKLAFTSNFGIRSDPFRGTAAMHAGVDIPGPVGTPVYATADGIIDRAERAGGYGNMVEVDHGKGIATRYGHLSKILVTSGEHIHRGQLIALMGSTGRSTGPHLHYEVRIDGHAVNPAPFLTSADYLLAAQDRSVHAIPISTDGPAPQD
jgi:murein DD-endopeptidase MepM/ murein hydrolase activator NlpD